MVRARRIELRRHAVMSCGPSHLARRAKMVRVRSSAFRHPPSKGGTLLTSFTLIDMIRKSVQRLSEKIMLNQKNQSAMMIELDLIAL